MLGDLFGNDEQIQVPKQFSNSCADDIELPFLN